MIRGFFRRKQKKRFITVSAYRDEEGVIRMVLDKGGNTDVEVMDVLFAIANSCETAVMIAAEEIVGDNPVDVDKFINFQRKELGNSHVE